MNDRPWRHFRGDVHPDVIERIRWLYFDCLAAVPCIAQREGVSRHLVNWAIDESKRRQKAKAVVLEIARK